jgi:hypothetical protein
VAAEFLTVDTYSASAIPSRVCEAPASLLERAQWRSLHRVISTIAAAFLLTIAFSGTWLAFKRVFDSLRIPQHFAITSRSMNLLAGLSLIFLRNSASGLPRGLALRNAMRQ